MKQVRIDKRVIGNGAGAFIIAEMSANHCGSFDITMELVQAAKRCGADAIKLADLLGRQDHARRKKRRFSSPLDPTGGGFRWECSTYPAL